MLLLRMTERQCTIVATVITLRSAEMHHSLIQTMVVPTCMGYKAWWYRLGTSQSFSHLRVLRVLKRLVPSGERRFDRLWRSLNLADALGSALHGTRMLLPAKMDSAVFQAVKVVCIRTKSLAKLARERAKSSIAQVLVMIHVTCNATSAATRGSGSVVQPEL